MSFTPPRHQVRQVCRACHNVCFVPEGTEIDEQLGYRCEACEDADYERHHFDRTIAPAELIEPGVTPPEAQPTRGPFEVLSAQEPEPAEAS